MDAIKLLKEDHRAVEEQFQRFEDLTSRAHKTMGDLMERITKELSVHAAIEEEIFYPFIRQTLPDLDDEILEDLEEHHLVKTVLAELDRMDPSDERFRAKAMVLIENVRHHVEEEEGTLFPEVEKRLGREALAELGEALEQAKPLAPTRPHPHAADEPPANTLGNKVAAIVDRARDRVSELVR